jgi:hypothetical protein
MPTTPCPGQQQPPLTEPDVVLSTLKSNDIITSPLIVEGKAKGYFFEGSFPVELVDANGNVLVQTTADATENWMQIGYVKFQSRISFDSGTNTNGVLIFRNDNPSGLSENAKSFQVPVRFQPVERMSLNVYLNNDKLDPTKSCDKVFATSRQVPKTDAVARAAIEELLKGPSQDERRQGYYTVINPGVKIQALTIDDQGVAHIDFDPQLQANVGGSCRVSAIRSEITQTLMQFSTIKSVIISINGEADTILQP